MGQGQSPDCRGKKSLICFVRLSYEPHRLIYNCSDCPADQKKLRGCKRNKRGGVTKLKCVCDRDKRCDLCKGTGDILLSRCPRALSKTTTSSITVPYFFHWKATGFTQYPDGRGRLFQPAKLLEAFNICHAIAARCEEEEIKKITNKK